MGCYEPPMGAESGASPALERSKALFGAAREHITFQAGWPKYLSFA
jgi:hypothetical protein